MILHEKKEMIHRKSYVLLMKGLCSALCGRVVFIQHHEHSFLNDNLVLFEMTSVENNEQAASHHCFFKHS